MKLPNVGYPGVITIRSLAAFVASARSPYSGVTGGRLPASEPEEG